MRSRLPRSSTLLSCAGLVLVGVGLTCVVLWGAPQHNEPHGKGGGVPSAEVMAALRAPDAPGTFVGTVTAVTAQAIVLKLPYLGQVRTLHIDGDTDIETANGTTKDLRVGDVVTVTCGTDSHLDRVIVMVPMQASAGTGG